MVGVIDGFRWAIVGGNTQLYWPGLLLSLTLVLVILVTGDADFAHLALQLRRRGIRVEVASVAQTLGAGLKTSANAIIDLAPLLATFDPLP